MNLRLLITLSIVFATIGCSDESVPTAQKRIQDISKRLALVESSQEASRSLYELSELVPEVKEQPRNLIRPICKILGDKDTDVRDAAPQCLLAFGQNISGDLLPLVNDVQSQIRMGALRALDILSKDPWDPARACAIVDALKVRLDNESEPSIRSAIIHTLARVSGDYENALELGLRESDRKVRESFAFVDQQHTPRSDKVFQLLADRIRDGQEHVYVRTNCMTSLGILFRERAVPVFIERLDDPGYTAEAAIDRLGSVRSDALAAIPELLRILETRPELRIPAVKALGEIRCKQSREVVERIVAMMIDGRLAHPGVELPLAKIAPENFPAVIDAVVSDDSKVRSSLERVLKKGTHYVRSDEQAATFVIARAFCDQRSAVRRLVVECHFNTPIDVTEGVELDAALQSLTQALSQDDDAKVRTGAAELINLMRGPTTSAISALVVALSDREPTVRRARHSLAAQLPRRQLGGISADPHSADPPTSIGQQQANGWLQAFSAHQLHRFGIPWMQLVQWLHNPP